MSGFVYRFAVPAVLDTDLSVINPDGTTTGAVAEALYIGGTGDVNVIMARNSNTVSFKNVPAGTILPIVVKQVLSSSSATNILVLNFQHN
jgi:hypothetical protein